MGNAIRIWIGGLLAIVAIDYLLRLNSDDFYRLGLGETLWFISHWILALFSLAILLCGWRGRPKGTTIRSVLGTVFLASVFYLTVIYLYVLGSGIDSL